MFRVARLNAELSMKVIRIGQAGDRGVDFHGHWEAFNGRSLNLELTGQCKRKISKITPSIIREVEGTFVGGKNTNSILKSHYTNNRSIAALVCNQHMTNDAKKAWWTAQTPILFIQLLEESKRVPLPIPASLVPISDDNQQYFIAWLQVNHQLRNIISKEALLDLDIINIRHRPR